MIRRTLAIGGWAWVVLAVVGSANAQLRMIGIAGKEIEDAPNPDFFEETITIWDVDMTDGSSQLIRELPFVPRDRSIEWNPLEGLLYRASGSSSRSDDPLNDDFRDNQYMDATDVYDFATGDLKSFGDVTVLFNANPNPADPAPDDIIPVFGDPGPAAPTWLLPTPRRTLAQSDGSWRQFGDGEFKKARDVVWSVKDNVGLVISDNGIFKYTPDSSSAGSSTLVGLPNDDPNTANRNEASEVKAGVLYHPKPGDTQFWVSMKESDGGIGVASPDLYQMDPATAQFDFSTGLAVRMVDENGTEIRDIEGLVSLEQDPNTGILYGVTKGAEGLFERELIQFETDENGELTGRAVTLGAAQLGDITETARYTVAIVGYKTGDMDQDGDVDFDDIAAFVLGLNDPAAYEGAFGLKSRVSGDTDGNGRLDFDDIGRFVDMLGAGGVSGQEAVPEPSGLVLAGLALFGMFGLGLRSRKRRK